MLRLLHIEWLKVKNYRTFWVLLVLMTVAIPSFCYIVFDTTDNSFPKMNGKSILGSPFSFPEVWATVPWFSSLVLFIPAVLIITLTTNEFVFKTHRQNVIDGWSRSQFISVKIIEIIILSVYVTILVFITCLAFGYYSAKPGEVLDTFKNSRYIWFFFIEAISYSMVALVISLLIKRAGLAMGVFFLYAIVLEQIIVQLLKKYVKDIGKFLPLEVTDRLIPQPFIHKFTSPEKIKIWESNIPVFAAVSVAYFFLYIFFCNYKFRKSDL
jgi:ABC-2 type transport system permease protein